MIKIVLAAVACMWIVSFSLPSLLILINMLAVYAGFGHGSLVSVIFFAVGPVAGVAAGRVLFSTACYYCGHASVGNIFALYCTKCTRHKR